MFTGIVEAAVRVHAMLPCGAGGRGLRVVLPLPETGNWDVAPGESIAVAGVCLTVAGIFGADHAGAWEGAGGLARGTAGALVVFDVSRETLDCTWFGALAPGRSVNLERALRMGDRLSGHLVAGHVDGTGRIADIVDPGDGGRLFRFEVEERLERYLVPKGSITLDGVSLTVVEPSGPSFSVAVIPETLKVTSLGTARAGDPINVEADMLGKWVERLL